MLWSDATLNEDWYGVLVDSVDEGLERKPLAVEVGTLCHLEQSVGDALGGAIGDEGDVIYLRES